MGRGDSPLTGRLVFATGCRRSGTNWLQRILTSHPDVVGMPSETYLFNGALSKVAERIQHSSPGSPKTGKVFMPREPMLDALRDFADRVFEENLARLAPEARYLVERTPWHVYDLDLIGQVYPDARVIQIVRDGRDVARSLLSQDWGPTRMEEAAEEWRSSVAVGREGGQALGQHYLEVRYEELLSATETGIREMFEWLGLDCDNAVLEHSLTEALSEFNVDPKAPRIAAGKWRDELSARDRATFDVIAGDLLEGLGYERDASAAPSPRPSLVGLRRRAGSLHRLAKPARRRRQPRRLSEDSDSDYAVFERFLELATADGVEHALGMLAEQVHVRIVDGGVAREGRGADGARLLSEHLAARRELEPRVLSGNVHPGLHTSTAVTTYGLLDGTIVACTLAVSVAEGRVTSVSLFEFELATPAVAVGA